MKEKELAKTIFEYCEEHKIKGISNSRFKDKLISFEIKDRQIYCKECGKKLEDKE